MDNTTGAEAEQQQQVAAAEPDTTPEAPATTPNNQDTTQEAQDPQVFDAEYVGKLRKESAGYRTKYRDVTTQLEAQTKENNELRENLERLLGKQEPNAEEKVTRAEQELADARAQLAAMRTEQAVTGAAAKHGTDPALTLALLKGSGKLDKLDPTADDHAALVAAAVEELASEYPQLGANKPRTSGQSPAPKPEEKQKKIPRSELKNMTPEAILEAHKAGLIEI